MKTLYESILDVDTKIMNRADKKAAVYLKRQKKIDLVLTAFEELILDWGLKFSHDVTLRAYPQIGAKNAIVRCFSKHNSNDQDIMNGYRFLKDKFVSIWSECIPDENLLLRNPYASFAFKDLGVKVKIEHNSDGYDFRICFDKNDKYIGDAIDKFIKKIS